MRERVARIGIDRAQGGLPGRQVVGMADVDVAQVTLRGWDHHPVRTGPADDPGDVAAQLEAHHQPAVVPAYAKSTSSGWAATTSTRCTGCACSAATEPLPSSVARTLNKPP